ncbi:CHASE domain-containing protein [Qipengyuania nanhaisediminis]|uniref:CHASE domain-containing protein n=1 Tax=Qipengyuania nanhaisediminis TaxID=604088 RepID=UPI0038B24D2E
MPSASRLAKAPKRKHSRVRWLLIEYPRTIPAVIFIAIAAITALAVYVIETNDRERDRAEARVFAQEVASALDRRGNSFSSYLRAGAALFATVDEVSPSTFRQFAAELRLDREFRGAEGIGWISVITPSQAGGFVSRMRAQRRGFPGIRPAVDPAANLLAPVTYFSPDTTRNRRTLGLDMYAEPVRAAAMDEARRTVQPTASGRIVLAQEGAGEAPGFAIFMPVYKVEPEGAGEARRLAGYVFSSFNASQFLDAAIAQTDSSQFGVRLYDGAPEEANLLVARTPRAEGAATLEQPVSIANRRLQLVVEFGASNPLEVLSMVTLIFGLALASLMSLVVRLLAVQAKEDEARLHFYEEQHSIRNSLTRELNHRVKNTLANVLSILSLTRRRASGLHDFANSLEGRIRALSATHDLLTGSDWATTPIRSVVEAELGHVVGADSNAVIIDGPHVELAPNDALSFGLAIHELATNAAKYGALSVPGGRVSVRWHLSSDNIARVEWCESDGPPVSPERKRGFGTELLEKIVAHELRHRVELDFRPQGVRCVIGVPVRQRGDFKIRHTAKGPD